MAHTPGPWRRGLTSRGQWEVFAPSEAMVCRLAKWSPAIDEDDARLIAAAPELLDALKQVRGWLLSNGPLKDDGITHPLFLQANNLVVAAIAKAEG